MEVRHQRCFASLFLQKYNREWSVLHMNENGNQSPEWSSRFGYIMVAAGAAIGRHSASDTVICFEGINKK